MLLALESKSVNICYQQVELDTSTRFAAPSTYSFLGLMHI